MQKPSEIIITVKEITPVRAYEGTVEITASNETRTWYFMYFTEEEQTHEFVLYRDREKQNVLFETVTKFETVLEEYGLIKSTLEFPDTINDRHPTELFGYIMCGAVRCVVLIFRDRVIGGLTKGNSTVKFSVPDLGQALEHMDVRLSDIH